jgi:hypothetical protein
MDILKRGALPAPHYVCAEFVRQILRGFALTIGPSREPASTSVQKNLFEQSLAAVAGIRAR